jgi:hypothetical protein
MHLDRPSPFDLFGMHLCAVMQEEMKKEARQ